MELKLYNSLTRTKEVFKPADPKRVTMYNCGPTVYSYAHIGNARAAVVADVLFRVLRHIYGEEHVIYARNITDVDDKIIAAAEEQGIEPSVITEKFAKIYNDDLDALNCLRPTFQPKATENIDEMQDIIVTLLEKGIAYVSENQILFDVTKKEDYGKLSNRSAHDVFARSRVEVAGYKKNPGDFLLWKHIEGEDQKYSFSAPKLESFVNEHWRKFSNQPQKLSPGRPGWHIECSAMVRSTLGQTIDIHCGGIDLKFPHHENEIAQSECANGKLFSRFWVHNEFLNMGSEKMSKSLGNVKLVHDLLKDWDGEVIRLALLKAHYRSELIWTEELLQESKAQLDGWYRDLQNSSEKNSVEPSNNKAGNLQLSHMLNDLNTPSFISYISKMAPQIGIPEYNLILKKHVKQAGDILGLLQKDPEEWFKAGVTDELEALCKEYDVVRDQAVAAKNAGDKAKMGELFKQSDQIRDKIAEAGFIIETGPDGSELRRK